MTRIVRLRAFAAAQNVSPAFFKTTKPVSELQALHRDSYRRLVITSFRTDARELSGSLHLRGFMQHRDDLRQMEISTTFGEVPNGLGDHAVAIFRDGNLGGAHDIHQSGLVQQNAQNMGPRTVLHTLYSGYLRRAKTGWLC